MKCAVGLALAVLVAGLAFAQETQSESAPTCQSRLVDMTNTAMASAAQIRELQEQVAALNGIVQAYRQSGGQQMLQAWMSTVKANFGEGWTVSEKFTVKPPEKPKDGPVPSVSDPAFVGPPRPKG